MDKTEILDLLIKEHYGLITEEERIQLEKILASDQEARMMQREVQARPKGEALDLMNRVDMKAGWGRIQEKYYATRSAQRRHRIRTISVAALVTGILVVSYLIWPVPEADRHMMVPPLAGTGAVSGPAIKLGNGEIVALKEAGQQHVTLGETQIMNNDRVLHFTAGRAATYSWNTLIVPAKLDYQVELSDGTKIWLNSSSSLRFPFAFGETREVYIEGEAYLEVARDVSKPFTVHSGESVIQVLGTSFNINGYTKGKLVTSLVEGKIAVIHQQKRVELKPGKELVIEGTGMKLENLDPEVSLGWRQGLHYFRDASMLEITEVIKRYYDVTIVLDEPAANIQHFRGKLQRHQPLQKFIDELNDLGVIKLYWKDHVLHCSIS